MGTLASIFKDNWEWRGQIVRLAVFELKKQSRGAVLGWAWFLIKPAMYIFCFWFAIDIGLKGGAAVPDDGPFILWLTAGIVPWFFMQKMLSSGINVFKKYSYLVNKVKFPLTAIPSIYELATMILQLLMQSFIIVVYLFCGQGLDIHLIQVPFLLLIMYAFWYFFSLLMSPLCAMSKDVKNVMATLSTPFFWLSGVIFDITVIGIDWVQTIMYFNPITSFVTAFRAAVFNRVWVWEDPMLVIGFAIVFIITVIAALWVHNRTFKEVADVF